MESKRENNEISLTVSNDEAIVLLEWLSRFNNKENSVFFEDQSERRVLWDIEAILEKNIAEIFDNNYFKMLDGARTRIRDAPL